MNTDHFYSNLKPTLNFKDILNQKNYSEVPDDWSVIITDVKGSTKAIESGRYKDVNTIGAASIVAVDKSLKDLEFPYVFGGDGSTFIVPTRRLEDVIAKLLGLKQLSSENFQLDLRVGVIAVKEIHENGFKINVAKYALDSGKSIAIFNGGGLTFAEEKIKKDEKKYEAQVNLIKGVDLEGLSCRWNPIKSQRGKILSLLVEAKGEKKDQIYTNVLLKLEEIFEGQLESANPVNFEETKYKTLWQIFQDEKRYQDTIFSKSFIKRLFEIILAVLLFKFHLKLPNFDSKGYIDSMVTHSDYRKFDDMLRMVIDCTHEQIKMIKTYLNEKEGQGQLVYGLHESDNCLMTCYLDNTKHGNHIHFIDGGDGGYAMAAKRMKSLKE
jgi:hypothetical protein